MPRFGVRSGGREVPFQFPPIYNFTNIRDIERDRKTRYRKKDDGIRVRITYGENDSEKETEEKRQRKLESKI